MRVDARTSERIRALGFLFACLVVPIHCASFGEGSATGWARIMQLIGTNTVSRLAVPWFFTVSGFFLFANAPTPFSVPWWRKSVVRRMATLGVPYLLWNAIYYAFRIATGKYGFDAAHCLEQISGWTFSGTSPACGQFWYVRCLFVYVLCAPMFAFAMGGRVRGLVALLSLMALHLLDVPGLPSGFQPASWERLLYFGTGVWIALHGGSFTGASVECRRVSCAEWLKRARGIALGVCFVFCALQVVCESGRMFVKLMVLSGLPVAWLLSERIARRLDVVRGLWPMAFFVYAAHVVFTSVAHKVCFRVLSPELYQSVGYLAKVFIGIGGSVVLGCAMRRFANPVYRLLCGGRG